MSDDPSLTQLSQAPVLPMDSQSDAGAASIDDDDDPEMRALRDDTSVNDGEGGDNHNEGTEGVDEERNVHIKSESHTEAGDDEDVVEIDADGNHQVKKEKKPVIDDGNEGMEVEEGVKEEEDGENDEAAEENEGEEGVAEEGVDDDHQQKKRRKGEGDAAKKKKKKKRASESNHRSTMIRDGGDSSMGNPEDFADIPDSLRSLRACLSCHLIKNSQLWAERDRCDNGCSLIDVSTSTTPTFKGLMALTRPNASWLAKWYKSENLKRGLYAMQVFGNKQ